VAQLTALPALPAELRASLPAELRGFRRDQVRLMRINRSAGTIEHARFDGIVNYLKAGDLLVVNTSRMLPVAIKAERISGSPVQIRPCVRHGRIWDALVVEPSPPHRNVELDSGERLLLAPKLSAMVLGRRQDIPLLWRLELTGDTLGGILERGSPIRYSYVPDPVPLDYYQPVYASHPGSAESPSAGLPLSWELLLKLRDVGVELADVVLHTGLSSYQNDAFDAEHHLYEEWFEVGPEAAAAIARTRRGRGRVIAVGTTVVRALESAAGQGSVQTTRGWTRLAVRPGDRLRAVDGLITGLHEPEASHFDLLRALLDEELLGRAYSEAIERRYLWHEFGDSLLIL
jgi:S-adenosylmethionine:tRNA ribosyltransferase-isomerase